MSRVAYIENGKVTNVALGDEAFATATGGIFTTEPVAKGWRYESGFFSPPPQPEPSRPPAKRLSQYGFRLLLTDAEVDLWTTIVEVIERKDPNLRSETERTQLRAWRDFHLPPAIELQAPETQAAIYALHLWGVLTQERADRVARGLPPT